ncbi:MAG TPA: DUF3078 domain-containing protein [Arachidicoccus sp.]|nr:DUF3078 domain-containing protein [Arachidicoccus sp.]
MTTKFNQHIFYLLAAVCIVSNVHAQDDIPVRSLPSEIFIQVKKGSSDTIPWKWKYGGRGDLHLSQSSLRNWAAGGEDFSMSLSSYVNAYLYYRKGTHSWDTNVDFNFGYVQTTSNGGRKNDDRIAGTTKYGIRLDSAGKLNASFLLNGRSQFFDGRKYFTKDSSQLISSFMSPAYAVISLGLDYKPQKELSIFASPLTTRLTVILQRQLAALGLYGLDKGHRYQFAPGAFATINYQKDILKNVNYRANLNLFSDYSRDPQNVDMDMSNNLSFKINKFLSASYSLDLIYDDDVRLFGKNGDSPGLQVKSMIGIGFSMPFRPGYARM